VWLRSTEETELKEYSEFCKEHQKQLQNVEYFNYLDSIISNDAKCTNRIKSRIVRAKAAFKKKKNLFTSKLDWILRKNLVKCYNWNVAFCGAENCTFGK
jgi:hypothetical protein